MQQHNSKEQWRNSPGNKWYKHTLRMGNKGFFGWNGQVVRAGIF